jgi:hypothetical protein
MAIMKEAFSRPFAQVISCILLPSNIFHSSKKKSSMLTIGGHLKLITHALLCSITHKLGTPYTMDYCSIISLSTHE